MQLPPTALRGLMRAAVRVASAIAEPSLHEQYWLQTLQPLVDRFKAITSNENFPRSYHQEDVRSQIVDLLESFIGVSQGVRSSTAQYVFRYTYPVLNEMANLLSLYHNYQQMVQLILEVLGECTRGMLCFIGQDDSVRTYDACLRTIQAYGRCNTNRVTIEPTGEDDTFEDIVLLMQLLINLVTKDVYDMGNTDSPNNSEPLLTPTDIFLHGLNVVMPMMTMNLLKYPALCRQYFKMLLVFCELYPQRVCSLQGEIIQKLLGSVELGLFSFSPDITGLSCDILKALTSHIITDANIGGNANPLMLPFVSLILNLILTHQINSDAVSNVAIPFYNLITCYQEQYRQVVQNLLASQNDREIAQRLADAFTLLTENIQANGNYSQQLKFRSNFDKFVVNVQGFMIVK